MEALNNEIYMLSRGKIKGTGQFTVFGILSPVIETPAMLIIGPNSEYNTLGREEEIFLLQSYAGTIATLFFIAHRENAKHLEEDEDDLWALMPLAYLFYGTSISVGLYCDIWTFNHNWKINREIKKVKRRYRHSTRLNTNYSGNYSLTVNPFEQKILLSYYF